MTAWRHKAVAAVAIIMASFWTSGAGATCTFNATGLTITPLTASTGTYTTPTAPTPQAVSITISGTYNTNASAGTCSGAISFQRGTLPATMANTSGGSATLPYTIQSASGGGNTLLFTGTTVALSNVQQYSFTSAGANLTNRAYSVTLTTYFLMQPGSPQAAGAYSDSLTIWVFDIGTGTGFASRGFTVTGTVTKVCTIGGVAHPSADAATIPITAAGAVNTAVINKSYASVVCNTPSNVQMTSQNGAVTNAGTASAGFTNLINYSSTAVFSGASASLNTATNPLATGPESGTAVSTTGTLPTGTMTVTITPQANVLKLISGTYSDTLTITITPQ